MTQYFDCTKDIEDSELKKVADILKNEGIVVFPTETVYGIGANALSEQAVKKIYYAKGRASDNPLIVHVSNREMMNDIVENINDTEEKLIENFMPGPFTLILKKKCTVPGIVSANLDTVGIRMPRNEIARKMIELAGVPIAAPSANVSGKPSGTNIHDIRTELEGKVDAIIDGGNSDIGLESTVVKVIDGIPTILRPGKITPEQIKEKIGKVELSKKIFEQVRIGEKVESPGMKYRHYAPNTKCVMVYSANKEKQIQKVNELADENSCVLGFKEHKDRIKSKFFIDIGSENNLEEISQNIFSSLRKADNLKVNLIIIEGVKKEGLGLAIMNRLLRACEYNIFEIE